MIASRSEIPSGPGLVRKVVGDAVLPLTTSLVFDTRIVAPNVGVAMLISAAANASAAALRRNGLAPIARLRRHQAGAGIQSKFKDNTRAAFSPDFGMIATQ